MANIFTNVHEGSSNNTYQKPKTKIAITCKKNGEVKNRIVVEKTTIATIAGCIAAASLAVIAYCAVTD